MGGVPGQKSMADIVKMGRPQNKTYNTNTSVTQPPSTHYEFEDYGSKAPEIHQEHVSVSPVDDWPSIEQPQTVGIQTVEPHVEPENVGHLDLQYERNDHTDEVQGEDEGGFEDHTTNHVEDTSGSVPVYENYPHDSFHHEDNSFEHNEGMFYILEKKHTI